MANHIKYTLTILYILVSLAGCSNYDARPESNAIGTILGCQTETDGHLCVVHYKTPDAPQTAIESREYDCSIADASQVYDGDTISNVQILVSAVNLETAAELGEVFPNVVLRLDGIYVENGLRIAGIDTPEMRPSKKKQDGTLRTEASRENEKKAAVAARDAVIALLAENNFRFTIRNVSHDKFGRVLADVWVGEVNVAEHLIENGYALAYDGGTKEELDWDRLDAGLVRGTP